MADDHDDLGDDDYRRFKDITYAAYFTIRQRTELSSDVLIFASLRILFMSMSYEMKFVS